MLLMRERERRAMNPRGRTLGPRFRSLAYVGGPTPSTGGAVG